MEEALASEIAPNILERCVRAAGEHLSYIWNYKKNIANLQTQVEKLDKERDDKRHSVTVAVRNSHKIKKRVKGWQDETDQISEEAIQIIKDYEENGKKRCLMGLCPNLVSRYQFSKRACKKEREILKAIKEAGGIGEVSDRAIGLGKEFALSTEGCFTFDSRKSIFEDIIKTLQDETKNSVGVYGLGGMGKTILAKQVASQVDKDNMFEDVAMASVTQKVNMKEIQGQIACMLDLKLEESSVAERASRLHERLKGKKVLVVLDDLWTELDLTKVGIPFGAEHMGCKVLLTSRSLRVLTSMGIKKEYVLGALKEDEAWRLFEEKVIHIVKKPTFLTIGKKVAKRCAGLPILIVTVAASLAKRPDLDAWNDALAQVRKMNSKKMHDIVNSVMESISYECLEETHKRLFLLCGLMHGDIQFEDILKYSLGWDLFGEDAIVTLEGARNRLQGLIFDLKESCLLLDGDHIKMHDVVRDVAISIARKDLNAFSAGDNDTDLSRWPNNDVLKKCTAMVFYSCPKLPCFPERLECPSLELFMLDGFHVDSKPKLPETFFERTGKLKLLDMSGLCFPTLPSTLSFLKNLQSLHLDYCEGLQDISMVGELKKLQVLSLIGSTIQELPSSLSQLSELKLLDLRRSQLKVIPAGLISGLPQLEELHMSESFDGWRSKECLNSIERSNVSFEELKYLHNLTCLKVGLRDAKLLAEDLNFENLKRYEIIVGDMWGRSFRNWLQTLKIKTIIALQLGTNSINHLQHVVNTMFKRIECLCLGELKGKNNVIPELNEDGFPELKHLLIAKESEIQYIVNVEDKQHKASFPALESLILNGLPKLEKICNAGLLEDSFYNLTILKVCHCSGLESLFSFSTIIALPCLQEIHVSSCNVLKEIVAKGRGEEEDDDDDVNSTRNALRKKIELAQLCKLALCCLPKFMTFFNDKKIPMVKSRRKLLTSEMESREIIAEEGECASSLPLFEEVSFPKLEELVLVGFPNLTDIWSHRLPEMFCCNLKSLIVANCDKLKYIFTPSHARLLVGLQQLTIKDCAGMEQIVAREEGETKTETIIFPYLSFICLDNLPNLSPFFDEKVQFPNLKTLRVKRLDRMKAIQTHNQPSTFPLSLIEKELPIMSFKNLFHMKIKNCVGLKYLLTPPIAMGLERLHKLTIAKCSMMEAIVGNEGGEAVIDKITFPQLVHLSLKDLPNLRRFYSKVEEMDSNQKFDSDAQHLFTEKVSFPKLEDIVLRGMSNLTEIWSYELREVTCCKLETLKVTSCDNLKYVFTPSIAMGLAKVKKLAIAKCSRMKAIVCNKGIEATVERITFPRLIHLWLEDLLNLTRFYSTVEEMDSNENLDIRPLFTDKIQFPRLEKLSIDRLGSINTIWQSQQLYEVNSFCKLEEVTVTSCASLLKIFPSTMLTTNKSSTQLRNLVLEKLPELEYICKQDEYSTFILNILDRLEGLYVTQCPLLKNLVPPSVSFKLLQELRISNCGGLINLLQPSTATSLEKLEFLYISGCEMIKEIIGEVRDDDEESSSSCSEDEIVFNKLCCLALEKLPRLTSFCSFRNYTFKFPALEKVYVIECPIVNTFCGGIITTPQLNKVCLDFISEGRWEGELNRTVEKIYEERKAERLATTLPSILGTNHPEAHAHEERVVGTCEKSKGKKVKVSEQGVEHFEKSETPRYSDPSCSNYTASSSQLSPQISNHPNEVSYLATQLEAHTPATTISTTSYSNQFEAQAQTHDMSPEKSNVKPEKESEHFRNYIEELRNKGSEVCENVTTRARKETETCEQVVEMEAQELTITLPSTPSIDQFKQEAEREEKSIEKFTKPTKEGRISKHVIHELGKGTSRAVSSSQQKDLKGLHVVKDSISLDELVRILQIQPVNNVSTEQVEFVEEAIGLLSSYIDKAKECLERKRTISELKLQIQALEDENDAVASGAPRFG